MSWLTEKNWPDKDTNAALEFAVGRGCARQALKANLIKVSMQLKKKYGIAYREAEMANDTQKEQILRKLARKGCSPIVAIRY